jgi:hypothetical protein
LDANEIIQIMTLVNALAPTGINLVKELATSLQGKTDEELKALGDGIDDAGVATADEEIAKLPPSEG